ncbi:MAG: hypothetical protein LBN26_02395 [Christensenellaceae bacterium]|jgi:hypothetical protein|nr:hypothetical protein [Christensenellaceae bacterium]
MGIVTETVYMACIIAAVLYCAAYAVFCAYKKKTATCICAAVLALLTGSAVTLILTFFFNPT